LVVVVVVVVAPLLFFSKLVVVVVVVVAVGSLIEPPAASVWVLFRMQVVGVQQGVLLPGVVSVPRQRGLLLLSLRVRAADHCKLCRE
jgi:hypothetical protein